METIIGIDPSLTCTGYAILTDEDLTPGLIKPKGKSGTDRLAFIASQVDQLLEEYEVDCAAIEGYSYGSFHSRKHALGELGGTIKLVLFERGVDIIIVSPAVLKKYTTGNGRATKAEMVDAVNDRWDARVRDHNAADAVALAHIGRAYLAGDADVKVFVE